MALPSSNKKVLRSIIHRLWSMLFKTLLHSLPLLDSPKPFLLYICTYVHMYHYSTNQSARAVITNKPQDIGAALWRRTAESSFASSTAARCFLSPLTPLPPSPSLSPPPPSLHPSPFTLPPPKATRRPLLPVGRCDTYTDRLQSKLGAGALAHKNEVQVSHINMAPLRLFSFSNLSPLTTSTFQFSLEAKKFFKSRRPHENENENVLEQFHFLSETLVCRPVTNKQRPA